MRFISNYTAILLLIISTSTLNAVNLKKYLIQLPLLTCPIVAKVSQGECDEKCQEVCEKACAMMKNPAKNGRCLKICDNECQNPTTYQPSSTSQPSFEPSASPSLEPTEGKVSECKIRNLDGMNGGNTLRHNGFYYVSGARSVGQVHSKESSLLIYKTKDFKCFEKVVDTQCIGDQCSRPAVFFGQNSDGSIVRPIVSHKYGGRLSYGAAGASIEDLDQQGFEGQYVAPAWDGSIYSDGLGRTIQDGTTFYQNPKKQWFIAHTRDLEKNGGVENNHWISLWRIQYDEDGVPFLSSEKNIWNLWVGKGRYCPETGETSSKCSVSPFGDLLEAPSILKFDNGKFYITMSGQNGWKPSPTYVFTSTALGSRKLPKFIGTAKFEISKNDSAPVAANGNKCRPQGGTVGNSENSWLTQHDELFRFIDENGTEVFVYRGDRFPNVTDKDGNLDSDHFCFPKDSKTNTMWLVELNWPNLPVISSTEWQVN